MEFSSASARCREVHNQTMKKTNAYYREQRARVKADAAMAVAQYWGKPVGCFDCDSRGLTGLTFHHLTYEIDSAMGNRTARRHEEAKAHPERFATLCWDCHVKREWADISKHGFKVDSKNSVQMMLQPVREKMLEDRKVHARVRQKWGTRGFGYSPMMRPGQTRASLTLALWTSGDDDEEEESPKERLFDRERHGR